MSLHLARGEVAGLLGPNGAGKTTCFYMITGLIAADYGKPSGWTDEDITNQPMYQRARLGLGYLPQETSIFRGMTVEQNVMAVVEMRESRSRDKRAGKITSELLEELHIAHLRSSRRRCHCRAASAGGSRSPGRWPANRPSCCSTSRSPASIPWRSPIFERSSATCAERGIGILITDHNVRETLDIIDRASIIHAGEVLFEGSPEEILADPEVRRVYLGDRFG